MDLRLKGKSALITGGSSGIGKGIATVLAGEGVNLAIASRNPDPEAIEELRSHGTRVEPIRADVSEEEQAVGMVEQAVALFGHLDLYVNNAAWTWHQPVTKIDSQSWFKTINTNLSAAMWACRGASRHMIGRGKGSIVVVSSTAQFMVGYGETSYRVSKFGLTALVQDMAVELAPFGIRVNMVTPGHFVTRMTGWDRLNKEKTEEFRDRYIPMRRFGDPPEVGNAVAFMLSDKVSNYVTGGNIVVDGGLHLYPVSVLSDDEIRTLNAEE